MDRTKLIERFLAAWSNKDIPELLKLMHSQASYYDAFWGETCTGSDLSKYFRSSIETDPLWYRSDEEIIPTPNGLIIRYEAFDGSDPRRAHAII